MYAAGPHALSYGSGPDCEASNGPAGSGHGLHLALIGAAMAAAVLCLDVPVAPMAQALWLPAASAPATALTKLPPTIASSASSARSYAKDLGRAGPVAASRQPPVVSLRVAGAEQVGSDAQVWSTLCLRLCARRVLSAG